MKIVLLEDEKLAADRLERQILAYDPSIIILAKLNSVQSAIGWFENNEHPDLIISDIQLADGPCFNIFDQAKICAPLIFATAYSEYAIRAFKYYSVDYLLKPVSQENLSAAINKYKGINRPPVNTESIERAHSVIVNDFKKRFLVKVGEHIYSIPVEEVLFFYSKEKVTYLKTRDHKNYIIDHPLDQIEKMVSPVNFYRINRQYIVSHESILNIVTYFNGKLKIHLCDCQDEEILISREKVNNFKHWLDL